MLKIKSILERMKQNPKEVIDMRFQFARYVFGVVAFLYFFVYLMNVGGFYTSFLSLHTLAVLTYHLYSILVIATFYLLYASIEYILLTQTQFKNPVIRIAIAVVCFVLALFPICIHTGIISFS